MIGWKVTGAVLLLVLAAANLGDPVKLSLALLAALAIAGLAARDLVFRERVAADVTGLTLVAGLRREHVPWAAVEKIRVDNRPRFGLRTELLEVDAGEQLYLFGAAELSAQPSDVADTLRHLWTGR